MWNLILEWVVYCLISVFMNNKHAIYKLLIFEFFVFQNLLNRLILIQKNIFSIEISLKLHLHSKN